MDLDNINFAIDYLQKRKDLDLYERAKFIYSSFDITDILDGIKVISELLTQSNWENSALAGMFLIHFISNDVFSTNLQFLEFFVDCLKELVIHDEPRVRIIGAKLIGKYAQRIGSASYESLFQIIYFNICDQMNRTLETRPVVLGNEKSLMLDDTTGWKSLETLFISYYELLRGSTLYFNDIKHHLTGDTYDLIINHGSCHVNRHIRQIVYEKIIPLLCQLHSTNMNENSQFIKPVKHALILGLQDNWCQVRLTSTFALHSFLSSLSEPALEAVWIDIIPLLSLNRQYMTESISQESIKVWIEVVNHVPGRGKILLNRYLDICLQYYITCSSHKNHVICEAACYAIAELGESSRI